MNAFEAKTITPTQELINRLISEPGGSVAGVALTCTVIEIIDDDSVQFRFSIVDQKGNSLVEMNMPIMTEGETVTIAAFQKIFNVEVSVK